MQIPEMEEGAVDIGTTASALWYEQRMAMA
jgi:hypothetical protein